MTRWRATTPVRARAPVPEPALSSSLGPRTASPDAGSLSAWLGWARDALRRAGIDTARPEAERLAAHALGVRWDELWARLRDPVDEPFAATLRALVSRRCSPEPLAYAIGEAAFRGLTLECGPGVLVPRPETETLVDVGLELVARVRRPVVADVGTGSGAVALAIAAARPDAVIAGTDVSHAALAYARDNRDRLGLNVAMVRGDLLGPLRAGLDLIVSNPPYVPRGRPDLLAPDVRREPPEALFAGEAGDEVLIRLVEAAPRWLTPEGALALEVGTPVQAAEVTRRLSSWQQLGVREDDWGRPRVVWARGPA
ncbi:MAG TPA: peptide chain release factor N(5)-glutamine methyltransferase [Actinomycetota bacterium]|nr:peptide chain release factor N(5)-glutamine methyltransferase [Actinomycetota bacterium]